MTRLLIETTDLTKRYGLRAAVDHVCLQVRSGEVYGFLGPNGAGKTTTLADAARAGPGQLGHRARARRHPG